MGVDTGIGTCKTRHKNDIIFYICLWLQRKGSRGVLYNDIDGVGERYEY